MKLNALATIVEIGIGIGEGSCLADDGHFVPRRVLEAMNSMGLQSSFNLRRLAVAAAVALLVVAASARVGEAQLFRGGAVGGVKVDVDGVLSNPEVSELKELRQAWQAGLQEVPADLQQPTELRFVSLKRLEAEAARAQQAGTPIADAVRFMAGLHAHQVCARVSRAARHRAGRAGRRLARGRAGQRGRRVERPAGAACWTT